MTAHNARDWIANAEADLADSEVAATAAALISVAHSLATLADRLGHNIPDDPWTDPWIVTDNDSDEDGQG
jgi:hypothetical protein